MSLDKGILCECVKTMLKNASLGMPDSSKHYAVRVFGGSDTTVTLSAPGQQPIVMKAAQGTEPVPTLALVDEGCAMLERFIDECNKDDCIGTQVGGKAIEDEVKSLLRQWLGKPVDDKTLAADVRESLKRLRSLVQPWTVYFSLENLILKELDEFVLGGIRLLPTVMCRSDIKARLFNHIDGSASDPKTKHATKLQLDDQVSEFYPASGTSAVLTVDAEQSRLRDVADHALGEVCGILRGFTHLLFRREHRCLFGLKGWLLNRPEAWLSTSVDEKNWNFSAARVGALYPYEITPTNVEHLRKNCALDILDKILCRRIQERTQVEQAIIVAAQWHGAAIAALAPAEEFVWHTVALERLLICDGETSTTELFSKRLAWLLGSSGEERLYLSTLATRLYNTRSCIVHAGDTRVEPEDLESIDVLASRAIIGLAERSQTWTSQTDMREWVQTQLMGA